MVNSALNLNELARNRPHSFIHYIIYILSKHGSGLFLRFQFSIVYGRSSDSSIFTLFQIEHIHWPLWYMASTSIDHSFTSLTYHSCTCLPNFKSSQHPLTTILHAYSIKDVKKSINNPILIFLLKLKQRKQSPTI